MKWTIAGAGVLLSVAGAYAVINGSSIIQVERGWATFIAGSVLLSGGIITLGIAALMGRIDNLTEVYIASIESLDANEEQQVTAAPHESAPPMAVARAEPRPSNENAAAPPAERETRAYQPAFTPPPAPEPVPEPVAVAPAPPLRDFKFVFPPAEAAPEPTPAPMPLARPAPLDIAKPAVAAASSLTWLRRKKQEQQAALAPPPPEPEPVIEPTPEPAQEMVAAEPESATLAGENFDDQRFASEPETRQAPEPVAEEPVQIEAKPEPEPASTPDPFSNDWLERALSGSDEPRLAPASLRREPVAERLVEAPAPDVRDEPAPQPAVIESEAAEPAAAPEPEPEPAHEPTPEPAAEEAVGGPPPVEIGRYRANDVAYVMFSDGSITAETPAGQSYRFNSLVELRAFIERGGS